jgi:uncharacterized membrane protein YgcG
MNCPFCANPAFEGIETCSLCGFSLASLDRIFGAIPRLTPELCDNAQVFGPAHIKRLRTAMAAFHVRFPQSSFHIVTDNLPATTNLKAYAFWLFNRASLSSDLNRGAGNHDFLLTIDAANKRAALIVGYGLEPFVNNQHLDQVLAAAENSFAACQYFEGTRLIIENTARSLSRIASGLDETYGISVKDIYDREKRESVSHPKDEADPLY